MICYFWKDFKPFIKVKMKQQDRALTSFKEMVQKTVKVEAKADLKSNIMVWDADSRCPRSHCPSQNTFAKVQNQGSTAKKSKPEEFRPKNSKPANRKTPVPPCINKLRKTSRQNKKKKYFKKKQDWKNSTLATRDNAIEGEKKQNNQGDKKCYNCQKRAILLETARNLQKTSVGLGNLCAGDW